MKREDVRFHVGIIAAAKNEMLKKEVLRLHVISRVVTTSVVSDKGYLTYDKASDDQHRREVQAGHDEIFRAIEVRDVAAAKNAMERHIQDIVDTKIRQMARSEEIGITRELTEDEMNYAL